MRNIIKMIAKYISKINQYTKDEEERIEYAMRIMTFETLKIIGVIIIFSLMGYSIQVIIALLTMSIAKPFIGGYHEDTQIKCFITTLIIIGSIIYLSIALRLDFASKLILNGVSLYCLWHQVPVVNPKMQITRPELIRRNRVVGMSATLLFILASIILYKYAMVSNVIVWTIIFQTLLMFNKRTIIDRTTK